MSRRGRRKIGSIDDNTPVIVGVGQWAERPGDPDYLALSPMDLAGRALQAAIDDCRAAEEIAPAIDTVAAIRQFEISTPAARATFGKSNNPPRSIARRVGADPQRAILELVGGQGPQKLLGELAADIAAGDSEVAAIVGSEAISTVLTLAKRGDAPDWSEEIDGQLEDRGYGMKGLLDQTVIAHGLAAPIPVYALFENARRAKLGLSPDAYRLAMGELFAPFTAVAADNPFAAAPIRRSAEELATVTDRNRIVAEPYPRMTVARDQVNQGAAMLVASAGSARRLGIPEERWVHIHGVAGAREASVLERADLAASPASIASVRAALDIAGIDMAEVRYLDLYSCFAIAVFNIIDAFGIAPDDPRGLTLTGGLPYFGGAGNNYSSHAIAEAVRRLRADREAYALVGANGGFMSKYATGILSCRPADWADGGRWRTLEDAEPSIAVTDAWNGSAVVESYTIVPDRDGGDHAVIVARTESGARCLAIPADPQALAPLREGAPFGRVACLSPGEARNNTFAFTV